MRYLMLAILAGHSQVALAQPQADSAALQHSVEELRTSIGRWEVVTNLLNPDGSVARSVNGTYEFSWVVPDRVASGVTSTPELSQTAGILFYINERKQEIEMVSVASDGRLWVMTGPMGGDVRLSQEYQAAGGGTGRLRFTRQNVMPDQFESRMEYSEDGGKTWQPGNHQTFRRVPQPTGSPPVVATTEYPAIVLPPELDRVLRDYEAAWTSGNQQGLAALFTDDGFVLSNGQPPVQGRAAIAEHYADAGGALTLVALAYSVGDTVGYLVGTYGPGGPATHRGKFLLAIRRASDGRWLIAADMDNHSIR